MIPNHTESTPIYDALEAELIRKRTIERTAELFEEAAQEQWPDDKPFDLYNAPTEEEWTNLMKFLASSLMSTFSDPDFTAIFYPEGEVGDEAMRRGELRAVGFTLAARALALAEYPEWEEVL